MGTAAAEIEESRSVRRRLRKSPFFTILGYGTMGALSLWSFLYGQRAKRRGEARRAAAAAASVSANA